MTEQDREDMMDPREDDSKDVTETSGTDEQVTAEETTQVEEEAKEASSEAKASRKFFKKETVSLAKYEELEGKLAKAHEEIESLKDSRMRLMAEYENYKRRTQKEKDHLYSDSVADVTKEWLTVLDNLERAALAVDQLDEDSDEDMIQRTADGVNLISKQAGEVLAKLGVTEIEALGKPFDPVYHEAVMRQDLGDDEIEPNTVVEVFAKGYLYGERVIRHSVVKVAN